MAALIRKSVKKKKKDRPTIAVKVWETNTHTEIDNGLGTEQGEGSQEGHGPRIHTGNLTAAWQRRPQPRRPPPGIHESHLPLLPALLLPPLRDIPAKAAVLL